jgi:hypothetical protein
MKLILRISEIGLRVSGDSQTRIWRNRPAVYMASGNGYNCHNKSRLGWMPMVKKLVSVLAALLLLSSSVAYAGDIPESIMAGNHLAMFIGRISDIGDDTMRIETLTVMMGKAGSELEVKRFNSYSIYPHYPKKGDTIVALLLDETTIDEEWVFECSSPDWKTLTIVCDEVDMVLRYQRYINEGAYFEAQKRLDAKAQAGVSQLATVAPTPETNGDIAAVAAGGAGEGRGITVDWMLLICAVVAAFLILTVLFAVRVRRKRSGR